jgi:hypothetical protein
MKLCNPASGLVERVKLAQAARPGATPRGSGVSQGKLGQRRASGLALLLRILHSCQTGCRLDSPPHISRSFMEHHMDGLSDCYGAVFSILR